MRLQQIVLIALSLAGIATAADTTLLARIEALERQVAELQNDRSTSDQPLVTRKRSRSDRAEASNRVDQIAAMIKASNEKSEAWKARLEAEKKERDATAASLTAEAVARFTAWNAGDVDENGKPIGVKAWRYRYYMLNYGLYQVAWCEVYDQDGKLVKINAEEPPQFVLQF